MLIEEASKTLGFLSQLAAFLAKSVEFHAVNLIAAHQTMIHQRRDALLLSRIR